MTNPGGTVGDGEESPGAVYIVFGNRALKEIDELALDSPDDPVRVLSISSSRPGTDWLGAAVSSGGDLDLDGVQEIAIGAAGSGQDGDSGGGEVILFSLPDPIPQHVDPNDLEVTRIHAADVPGGFGWSIQFVGDANGDGRDDLLVGESGSSQDGDVYLIHGSPDLRGVLSIDSLIDDSRAAHFDTIREHSGLGKSVGAAGDLNRDGIDDFWMIEDGWPGGNLYRAGRFHIIFGSPEHVGSLSLEGLLDRGQSLVFEGEGNSGETSAGLGGLHQGVPADLNGDGMPELALAAPSFSRHGRSGAGQIYGVRLEGLSAGRYDLAGVLAGELDGFLVTAPYRQNFAGFIATVGDTDGDDRDDIVASNSFFHDIGVPPEVLSLPPGVDAHSKTYLLPGRLLDDQPLWIESISPRSVSRDGTTNVTLLGAGFSAACGDSLRKRPRSRRDKRLRVGDTPLRIHRSGAAAEDGDSPRHRPRRSGRDSGRFRGRAGRPNFLPPARLGGPLRSFLGRPERRPLRVAVVAVRSDRRLHGRFQRRRRPRFRGGRPVCGLAGSGALLRSFRRQ